MASLTTTGDPQGAPSPLPCPPAGVCPARRHAAWPTPCARGAARRPWLGDHAVEVAARRGPEMLRRLGRDDRQRHRRQLAAHGETGVAPQRFRDAEVVPQPVGGVNQVRPGRVGAPQIGLELRCQPHQLVQSDPVHHALFRPLRARRCWGLSNDFPLPRAGKPVTRVAPKAADSRITQKFEPAASKNVPQPKAGWKQRRSAAERKADGSYKPRQRNVPKPRP
jgi:hypothetical protein